MTLSVFGEFNRVAQDIRQDLAQPPGRRHGDPWENGVIHQSQQFEDLLIPLSRPANPKCSQPPHLTQNRGSQKVSLTGGPIFEKSKMSRMIVSNQVATLADHFDKFTLLAIERGIEQHAGHPQITPFICVRIS